MARWARAIPGRPVGWGVAGAVVTMLCLGTIAVLALPPFLPSDESSHAAYALTVADGDLARLDDTVEAELPGQQVSRLYLANHPPLYYAIAGPVLEAGMAVGHPTAGVRLVRWLSVVCAAGTVVVAAGLARLVVRRRRAEATILAAGLTATVPMFVATSAMLHNDLLAVLSAAVAGYGAVAALVRGPSRANVALVGVGSAVTMATRINGASLVALAGAALGLAVLLHGRPDAGRVRRWLRAAGLAAVPAVLVVATSGWYYLHNHRLYGDIAGVGYNRGLNRRNDRYTPLGYMTERRRLPDLLTRVEGGGPVWDLRDFGRYDAELLVAIVALTLVGAALAVAAAVTRWRSTIPATPVVPAPTAERAAPVVPAVPAGAVDLAVPAGAVDLAGAADLAAPVGPAGVDPGVPGVPAGAVDPVVPAEAAGPDDSVVPDDAGVGGDAGGVAGRWGWRAAVGFVVVVPLLLWVQLAWFVAQTGSPNPRYMLAGVPAVAVIVAGCLLAWRGRAGVGVATVVLAVQATLSVTTVGRWITRRTEAPRTNPLDQLADAFAAAGVPAPTLVLALLLAGAATGLALQAATLWSATVTPATTPAPTAAPATGAATPARAAVAAGGRG